MVTGYDIIFFWVARMIFSGMEQMKKEPFKTVFIHGLVRDDSFPNRGVTEEPMLIRILRSNLRAGFP